MYFKGGYISEKDRTAIISTLQKNPYTVAIYELSGEFDLAIEMESPNPSRFNKELKKAISALPTLNNYKIVLNVVTHIYPRTYLLSSSPPRGEEQEIVVGGDREVMTFAKEDLQLMAALLQQPRIRYASLAKQTSLNVKTVRNMLAHLQAQKVIRGFRYTIDTTKIGVQKMRLFLKLHNISKERETQLLTHFLKTKEVVQVNKTVGDWDMEVDLEAPDKNVLRRLIITMREEFKDLIQTFNSIEFYQMYKRSYLPGYLFKKEEE